MLRLLVLGIVVLLSLTGCLRATGEPDVPAVSGAMATGSPTGERTAQVQPTSEPTGEVSTSATQAPSEPSEAPTEDEPSPGGPPAGHPEWGPLHDVLSVYDGDTIAVDLDGVRERVRVIGIDAPEMARSGTDAECYAQPAASRMQSLVQGNRVHLLSDSTQADRDRYDRLLRHVVLDGGGHVGLILLEEGFAVERQYADPYQWQTELRSAQGRAQANGLGLWTACVTEAGSTAPPQTPVLPAEPLPAPALAPAPADPVSCVIKGNIDDEGERIYHVPGQRYYGDTVVSPKKGERWFCSEEEAVQAGWRRAKI